MALTQINTINHKYKSLRQTHNAIYSIKYLQHILFYITMAFNIQFNIEMTELQQQYAYLLNGATERLMIPDHVPNLQLPLSS